MAKISNRKSLMNFKKPRLGASNKPVYFKKNNRQSLLGSSAVSQSAPFGATSKMGA